MEVYLLDNSLLMGDSTKGCRASFLLLKTGGKRSVISNHFFELFLKITEIEMLPIISLFFLLLKIVI